MISFEEIIDLAAFNEKKDDIPGRWHRVVRFYVIAFINS